MVSMPSHATCIHECPTTGGEQLQAPVLLRSHPQREVTPQREQGKACNKQRPVALTQLNYISKISNHESNLFCA